MMMMQKRISRINFLVNLHRAIFYRGDIVPGKVAVGGGERTGGQGQKSEERQSVEGGVRMNGRTHAPDAPRHNGDTTTTTTPSSTTRSKETQLAETKSNLYIYRFSPSVFG